MKKQRIRVNERIYAEEVRLIDQNKEQIGIVKVKEALIKAQEANLDLVEISPNAKPPVCKIMDFGKFKYEEKKKAQQSKKNQQTIKVKELRMRPNIGDHDLENKLKMGKKFLSEGYKLKLTLMYRGREMSRQDLGQELMQRVLSALSEYAELEKDSPLTGRKKSIILAPK
ncbi:MAG: translation initiation factor IF-3 [Candidatus Marinimicrobia bacterium]|nr:translation initiation factor IF-3 [Candidatus Neomarinimicrobiota bacterium]